MSADPVAVDQGHRDGSPPPDVTVILPVYDTMPYLTGCLDSLLGQSIGLDRMRIVAVDDGSTDGSGRQLDRYARRYPGTVTVVHQPNSGGPAAPCNRALDLATGRYVFFVGADDRLGPEALERLVAAADRYGSDVVLGRVVGVNSRHVHQEVFARTAVDVGLADSALPLSLANTKLFRRELVERHRLRYPEDMPIGSDQPFTLEACHRAARVTVLADYDYYHAVRRLNARNITYLSRAEERLDCARRLVEFAVGLIPPGDERDAVLRRYFRFEVAALLDDDFLRLDAPTRRLLHAGVRELAGRHLTAAVRGRLPVETRLRIGVAEHGTPDDLVDVIREDAERGVPPTVVEGARRYAAYPGFRASHGRLPDDVFDVTDAVDWLARFEVTGIGWDRDADAGPALVLDLRTPLPDLGRLCPGPPRLTAGELAGDVRPATATGGTTLRARISVTEVLRASAVTGQRRAVHLTLPAPDGRPGSAPLRAPRRVRFPRPMVRRRGRRWYAVSPVTDGSGRLMISVVPLTPRRVLARLTARRPS
ncbi:Glycosyltransferase involved in cell wall bisynthesis [Micromonospora echinofusca]|uniref:Glycosyltransferase involved in cell wall bisynthesis n=2 Tax=Micromonospora echinofusca TaxID=47858 RepID=A0A1C5G3Y3_MICEH|nr:glycosyltransferase [Micromonospora echinofusca]SCG14418.1 Glycosyltransferase involved in cell wall bisynthesis [Micromonospora echinofusca]